MPPKLSLAISSPKMLLSPLRDQDQLPECQTSCEKGQGGNGTYYHCEGDKEGTKVSKQIQYFDDVVEQLNRLRLDAERLGTTSNAPDFVVLPIGPISECRQSRRGTAKFYKVPHVNGCSLSALFTACSALNADRVMDNLDKHMCAVSLQVWFALTWIHSTGNVHGDVHPKNVMISWSPNGSVTMHHEATFGALVSAMDKKELEALAFRAGITESFLTSTSVTLDTPLRVHLIDLENIANASDQGCHEKIDGVLSCALGVVADAAEAAKAAEAHGKRRRRASASASASPSNKRLALSSIQRNQ
jgi:serine/threonine protein kinase